MELFVFLLHSIINQQVFYHECGSLMGYASRYLFCYRCEYSSWTIRLLLWLIYLLPAGRRTFHNWLASILVTQKPITVLWPIRVAINISELSNTSYLVKQNATEADWTGDPGAFQCLFLWKYINGLKGQKCLASEILGAGDHICKHGVSWP